MALRTHPESPVPQPIAPASATPVHVCLTPRDLRPELLHGHAVVVFDVLRATTTMTAALAAGVTKISIFGSIDGVRAAQSQHRNALLCGEEKCLRPAGFDLGNSPGVLTKSDHNGRELLMSTTNGTRAILAVASADKIFIGALVNASAVARQLRATNLPVTLCCAGTDGDLSIEDTLGAGAVIHALSRLVPINCQTESARLAHQFFQAGQNHVPQILKQAQGGKNLIRAGLEQDIDFAARLDVFEVVGQVSQEAQPVVTAII